MNTMAFPGLVTRAFNLKIQKAKEGRFLWVWGYTDPHGKTLPHTNSKNEASSIFLKETRTKKKKMLAMPHDKVYFLSQVLAPIISQIHNQDVIF